MWNQIWERVNNFGLQPAQVDDTWWTMLFDNLLWMDTFCTLWKRVFLVADNKFFSHTKHEALPIYSYTSIIDEATITARNIRSRNHL